VNELFGDPTQVSDSPSWLPIILNTTKTDVRAGLKEAFKKTLLAKYEPKNDLSFLIPPKINREIHPNLSATVMTRDTHQSQSQLEVETSLNALASGFSDLSRLEPFQGLPEMRLAMSKIADGIRLLADHHFNLSKTRRAFILPSLNFLGKVASDSASVDEYLFGSNFTENVNTAQAMEKVANKMAKKNQRSEDQGSHLTTGQQPKQQRNQPLRIGHPNTKNPKAPPQPNPINGSLEEEPLPGRSRQEIAIQIPSSPLVTVSFAGRLALFFDHWKILTSDPMVLGTVKGYQIPFSSVPLPRPSLIEPSFSAQKASTCDTEVMRLLQKGTIEVVTPLADQFLSPFFVIKKSSGGMRFILNLRDLNSYINPSHFKLEDWRTVIRLMLPGFKLAIIDLEDAYLLIPIHKSFRRFLRFQ
ncbi:hypothetical protein ALC57_05384, partial [Trachymyrmex cornetzi]